MIFNILEDIIEAIKASNISEYKIIETKVDSEEMFFVKKALDLSRSKEVHHFSVTLFKEFKDGENKFKGSSVVNIHPTMNKDEIKAAIEEAAFACKYVKNEYYEINFKNAEKEYKINSSFSKKPLSKWMNELIKALYKNDNKEKGHINSSEIFMNKIYKRIITSQGVDTSYEIYNGMIEFVISWKEKEEIELYKNIEFSDFDEIFISETVEDMLHLAEERAKAKEVLFSGKYNVIFSGSPVKEILSYYYNKANAVNVYNGTSEIKLGSNVQGKNVIGDVLNITLDPELKGSTESFPCDDDGFGLKATKLYEKGVLKSYIGDVRHSYYLGTNPTGNITNFTVGGGSKSYDDMKREQYLELTAFSDFQMDPITGDFAGEIRLGWYNNGKTTIPITGGSVSGNIKDFHKNMTLSKELQQLNNFKGPKAIQMLNVVIAGK